MKKEKTPKSMVVWILIIYEKAYPLHYLAQTSNVDWVVKQFSLKNDKTRLQFKQQIV